MNKTNLKLIFDQYIDRFAELNDPAGNNEGYKWTAESCFVANWNIDADDFPTMFKAAMKETSNLIDNATIQPVGGILLLLKQDNEVEFVRECFRSLFAEDDGDIDARQDRIYDFIEKINAKIDQYAKGSWKYPQTVNSVIYYLCLRYPNKNYIYKATEATEWANCVEYGDDFGSGQSFSLAKYYKMCDELLEAVLSNDEIMQLHRDRFSKYANGFDDECHILVYDIIYCAHTYHFYTDGMIHTTSTKERINRATARAELDALENRIQEIKDNLSRLGTNPTQPIDMVGMTIVHKAFGSGTVKSQTSDIQVITFAAGDKKFQFPTAYIGGFLKADDEIIQKILDADAQAKEIKKLENELKGLEGRFSRISRTF